MSLADVATVIGAVTVLITSLNGVIQSRRIRRELQRNSKTTEEVKETTKEVHQLVNSTADELRARVEQLTQVISDSGAKVPKKP